jgi:S1/P1 Nuclease
MHAIGKWFVVLLILCGAPGAALACGGHGHRTVAAIAMSLIPEKAARMSAILTQLETDDNFIDAASYPDEFIRDHDLERKFSPWHFSDLRTLGTLNEPLPEDTIPPLAGSIDEIDALNLPPVLRDDGRPFVCGECLFKALQDNIAIIRAGRKDKSEPVAIAWVLHLVGDLHQPLHMAERLRGGNDFHVTYRGKAECKNFQGHDTRVELHSAWDDCLVDELANGRGEG